MLGRKSEFDSFVGFARRGFPLPFAQRILGGLRKQWMTALYFDGLDRTVGGDQHVGFDAALDVHRTGKAGILRSNTGYNLAAALGTFLRPSAGWSQRQQWCKQECRNSNTMPHKFVRPYAEYKRDPTSFVDYVGNAANNRLNRGRRQAGNHG
jgi:hypothetical protein